MTRLPLGFVTSGLAVSLMARSSMTSGMRALSKTEGFPDLPVLRVCLITSPRNRTDMVQALEAFLVRRMRARMGAPVDRPTPPNKRIRKRQRKKARR